MEENWNWIVIFAVAIMWPVPVIAVVRMVERVFGDQRCPQCRAETTAPERDEILAALDVEFPADRDAKP